MKLWSVFVVVLLLAGCQAPLASLTFPYRPLHPSTQPQWFDVNHDGKNDFAITYDSQGRVDALMYDDNEDGKPDRIYHLRDYPVDSVPHVIILLDSVPFQSVADRYAAGEFRWFDPPSKVIAPFPSLTEICFTELLHAAPMPAMIDQYYDTKNREIHNGLFARAGGLEYPWERYLNYRAPFVDEPFAYLNPLPWYHAELELSRRAVDSCPDRTVIVYLTTASGTICRDGRQGVDEVLDGAARLCLQLLYERRGAVKISMMADHGHNLMLSQNINIEEVLRQGGFNPASRLRHPNDVVLEMNGLVTYAAVRTVQPANVSAALLKHPAINMAMYMQGEDVIVRDPDGEAAIQYRDGKLRYKQMSKDVLGYTPVLQAMGAGGKLDADGFASETDWFAATKDVEYPDAPKRLWDAFHREVINPPEVMFTTRNGYMAGLGTFARLVTMKSTHGSLDQINSATFVMTMNGSALPTLQTKDVMHAIEPSYVPGVEEPGSDRSAGDRRGGGRGGRGRVCVRDDLAQLPGVRPNNDLARARRQIEGRSADRSTMGRRQDRPRACAGSLKEQNACATHFLRHRRECPPASR